MTIEVALPRHFDLFLIREWTVEDAEQLADIEFDPEVKQYLGSPSISREEFIERFQPDLARGWAIAINPGHIVAGTIAMNTFEMNPKKRELRILLAREYRSRGFASEAARFLVSCIFGAPWIEGVVGVVHPRNLASIALLRKLGFVHTVSMDDEQRVYELNRAEFKRSLHARA